jgi:hypothetical protein
MTPNPDSTERHFQLMVLLMMTFFFTQIGIEGMIALKWAPPDSMAQSLQMSHDAFLSFFGLAAGIFHGMVPQLAKPLMLNQAPVPPEPQP